MKVSELAKVVEKGAYFSVYSSDRTLLCDYPENCYDCDLEIKEVYVGACDTLVVITENEQATNSRFDKIEKQVANRNTKKPSRRWRGGGRSS
ncbi:hypothetical protein ACTGZQ_10090 [Streptococcus suis]